MQRLREQKGVLHLKSLLSPNSTQETRVTEEEPMMDDDVAIADSDFDGVSLSDETPAIRRSPRFVPFFDTLDSAESPAHSPANETDDETPAISAQPISAAYFLRGTETPSLPALPAYSLGSPIFIGEVAAGIFAQRSAVAGRPPAVFHDVAGVARNAYETYLRLNPTKRPLLVGIMGHDESAGIIARHHGRFGDTIPCVSREKGPTQEIWGFYDTAGFCEREFRLAGTHGVTPAQLEKVETELAGTRLVFVDSSPTPAAMAQLAQNEKSEILLDPAQGNFSAVLSSGLLRRADFVLPSVEELWQMAVLIKPSISGAYAEWREKSGVGGKVRCRRRVAGVSAGDSAAEGAAEGGAWRDGGKRGSWRESAAEAGEGRDRVRGGRNGGRDGRDPLFGRAGF